VHAPVYSHVDEYTSSDEVNDDKNDNEILHHDDEGSTLDDAHFSKKRRVDDEDH
jgi:hypothetical protein